MTRGSEDGEHGLVSFLEREETCASGGHTSNACYAMTIMRAMHDRAADVPDLDLLVLFDALATERHMTRAAASVGLSQPAMSRALGRMRELFRDPLLVRTARGMLLTPRGEELVPSVRRVLADATSLVRRRDFAPRDLARTFAVGTIDYLEA